MIQVPRVLALVPPARLFWGNALDHPWVSGDGLGAPGVCRDPPPPAWERALPNPAPVPAAGQRGAKALAGSAHCP